MEWREKMVTPPTTPLLGQKTAFNSYNTNRGETPPTFSRGLVATPITLIKRSGVGEGL